jgi:hypothetical protein
MPRARRFAAASLVTAAVGLAVLAQPPAAKAPTGPPADAPVAYIYDGIPVTRHDLGEFLMARGGVDKLELLINKKIIEHECAKRGVTVTETELLAALEDDLKGLSVSKADFVKVVLAKYSKTLYEWMEDVIRPKLLLDKLCVHRVKVTAEDLAIQYEREYGEKRRVQIIIWPLGDDQKAIMREWEKLRTSQQEFDRVARQQANPTLAVSAGNVKPVSRHLVAEDPVVEQMAFQLTAGEVSQVLKTKTGYLVMKLHEIIPPATGIDREKVKERHAKQAFEERLAAERPKMFAELQEKAKPRFVYGGPTEWKYSPDGPATAGGPGDLLQGVQPAGGKK